MLAMFLYPLIRSCSMTMVALLFCVDIGVPKQLLDGFLRLLFELKFGRSSMRSGSRMNRREE